MTETDNQAKIEKILQNFRDNIKTYEEFCLLNVKPLLEKLLADSQIKAQSVTARSKSYKSYEQKIRNRFDQGQKTRKYNEIRDLAGCRVIFYNEDELNAFVKVVQEQFEVVHSKQEVSEDGYNAIHLTVKLSQGRTNLPEYRKFKDLQCEVQFTTVLAHAWAEQNHDLIYKDEQELKDFDPQAYEALDAELKAIMKEHLIPATRRFGIVQKKAERIRQGQRIFNTDYLSSIPKIENNNEMYNQLKLLESYVRELSEEKTPDDVDIIELLKQAIQQAKKNKVKQDDSIFGRVRGSTQLDITSVVLDILDIPLLKYNHFNEVFPILQKFSRHRNSQVKEKALKNIANLAKYNYHVIKQVDYAFQRELISKIKEMPVSELMSPPETTIKMLEELLSSSFEGSSFDSKTQALTIHQGPLIANEDLRAIRKVALEVLFKMYEKTRSFKFKEQIMNAIQNATRVTDMGNYSDELIELLEESSRQIIDFFIKNAPRAPLALLLDMEEELIWLRRRFNEESLTNLEDITNILAANEDYQVYRVLAGHPGRLTIDPVDIATEDKLRDDKVNEFIADINDSTKEKWFNRIADITHNHEPGGRRLLYFEDFLTRVGEERPGFAMDLITNREAEVKDVLNFLLRGVLTTDRKEDALKLIDGWIEEGSNLSQSVFALWDLPLNQQALEGILKQAQEKHDDFALISLLRLLFRQYPELTSESANKMIFAITDSLDRKKYRHWLELVWYNKEILNQFIDSLDESEINNLLQTFIATDNINYHSSEVLASIARTQPKKVMELLRARVLYKDDKRSTTEDYFRYDAIPYHLDELGDELKNHPEVVLEELVKWLNDEAYLLRWETAHFLHNLYPAFEQPISTYLEEIVESKDTDKIETIVLPVLREYKGHEDTHTICKKIVKEYGNKYDSDLFIALSESGVVSGQYGFVQLYKAKQESVKPWLEDADEKVKAFAKRYIDWLEKRIQWEKKRADDDQANREAGLN